MKFTNFPNNERYNDKTIAKLKHKTLGLTHFVEKDKSEIWQFIELKAR